MSRTIELPSTNVSDTQNLKNSEIQKEIEQYTNGFKDCWYCEADKGGNWQVCNDHKELFEAYNFLCGKLTGRLDREKEIIEIIEEKIKYHNAEQKLSLLKNKNFHIDRELTYTALREQIKGVK